MKRFLVSCAALLITVASSPASTFADEYGPKTSQPKVAWVAVYLNAKPADPKLSGSRGFTLSETKVHVGDHIVFFNIDDEVHTATVRFAGAFPPNAIKPMGHRISEAWQTGNLEGQW